MKTYYMNSEMRRRIPAEGGAKAEAIFDMTYRMAGI